MIVIEHNEANKRLHLHFFSRNFWTGNIMIANIDANNIGMINGFNIYNIKTTAMSERRPKALWMMWFFESIFVFYY
ncbi:MAG TPA: hypothetical protein VGA80_01445 [Flavobacteriaceae bacterium]|jgi:hypothetical protein